MSDALDLRTLEAPGDPLLENVDEARTMRLHGPEFQMYDANGVRLQDPSDEPMPTLAQVAEHSEAIARGLSDAPEVPVRVVHQPVVTTPDEIHRVVQAANVAPNCVGIVAWMHTFSPAKMWIAGLEALRTPLLHLHTQANVELPWDTIDFDFMNLNQAAHGDREFGYIQTRLGVARKTVAGHVTDPRVLREVEDWQRAAAGWAAARGANAESATAPATIAAPAPNHKVRGVRAKRGRRGVRQRARSANTSMRASILSRRTAPRHGSPSEPV